MNCHCGQPLHYASDALRRYVEEQVRLHGEFIPVSVDDRTWLVQRHYLALHGLAAKDVASLGFKEVKARARPK